MLRGLIGLGALAIAAFFAYTAKIVHDRGESMKGPIVGAIVAAAVGLFILLDRGEPSPARRKVEGVLALGAIAGGWIAYLRSPAAANASYQSGQLIGLAALTIGFGVFALRRLS